MISDDLFGEIKDELRNRTSYEEKQRTWYTMRYTGVKRARKPYPNAPDTHYPLCDTIIDKLRPFYLSQIYGQERVAAFVSGKPQPQDMTALAEQFFDYSLKQRSNFERAILTSIDYMLMYGRGPIKTYWDDEHKEIRFSPIRPIYIVVPSWTEEICDADWLVHIMHLSERQYRENDKFTQGDAFIKSIKGRGGNESTTQNQENEIKRREGITCGQTEHQIVIWEVYSRDGKDIKVDTMSPILGIDKAIRPTFAMPYAHGEIPFSDMRYEITDQDYYSPRGVVEILSQHELDLCNLWNQKLQFLAYHGQPMFENEGMASNTGNISPKPGLILPAGLKPIISSSAPMDYSNEMQLQRALAEDRIQIPDLGANQHLSSKKPATETATGIDAILAQSSAGNDMRSRVFKLQLARLFNQAWSILADNSPKDQLTLDDYSEVPPDALKNEYRIAPSGSADSYSKEKRTAKAMAYYQTFAQAPFAKPIEMAKNVIEQDDPSLIKRFFQDPMDTMQDQAEQQSVETLLMLNERQPRVHPADDDKAHLSDMANWTQHRMQSGQQITPDMAKRLLEHSQGHAQAIMQNKDKQGMELLKQLQPGADMLAQIAQGGQPQMAPQAQGGGVPPQAGAPQGGQPMQPPPSPLEVAQAQSDMQSKKLGDSARLMGGLSQLINANVPVSADQINQVMNDAGLPPLGGPPVAPPKQVTASTTIQR